MSRMGPLSVLKSLAYFCSVGTQFLFPVYSTSPFFTPFCVPRFAPLFFLLCRVVKPIVFPPPLGKNLVSFCGAMDSHAKGMSSSERQIPCLKFPPCVRSSRSLLTLFFSYTDVWHLGHSPCQSQGLRRGSFSFLHLFVSHPLRTFMSIPLSLIFPLGFRLCRCEDLASPSPHLVLITTFFLCSHPTFSCTNLF